MPAKPPWAGQRLVHDLIGRGVEKGGVLVNLFGGGYVKANRRVDVAGLYDLKQWHGLAPFDEVVAAAVVEAVQGTGAGIHEDAGAGDDLSLLRSGEWNLDDVDAEERGVGVLVGRFIRAAGQLFALANERGAGDVDVDVGFVVGIDDEGVGVRSAAGLDGCDLLGILDVGNIEDAYALARILDSPAV